MRVRRRTAIVMAALATTTTLACTISGGPRDEDVLGTATEQPEAGAQTAPDADSDTGGRKGSGIARSLAGLITSFDRLRDEQLGDDAGTDAGPAVTTIDTNKTSYAFGEQITVTFANLSGAQKDWIAFAPAGSTAVEVSMWRYTKGTVSGTYVTDARDKLPPGTFVARAYFDDGYAIAAESAAFDVTGSLPAETATITTDKSTYSGTETVRVTFAGLAGTAWDWVGVYRSTASMMSYSTYAYTGGGANGSVDLSALYLGTWEVRAFENDSYDLVGRSAPIDVATSVTTDKSSYGDGEPVVVHFGGMQGYYGTDRVALAVDGSGPDQIVADQYVSWNAGGSRVFDTTLLPDGSYVARAYFQGDPAVQAESAPFTIAR